MKKRRKRKKDKLGDFFNVLSEFDKSINLSFFVEDVGQELFPWTLIDVPPFLSLSPLLA